MTALEVQVNLALKSEIRTFTIISIWLDAVSEGLQNFENLVSNS